MSLEQKLRDTPAAERRSGPARPDAVDRVGAGIRWRRRRRHVVVALVLSMLIVTVATPIAISEMTGGTAPAGAPDSRLVPWLDSPAAAPSNLARRAPRPDQRPCAAGDLGRSAWVEDDGGVSGRRTHTVLIANAYDARCTLSGSAAVTAVDGDGRRTTIPIEPLAPVRDPARQHPATIDPGEPARIDIAQAAGCGGSTSTGERRTYRDLAIVLHGRSFPLSDLEIDEGCGISIGQWYVQPPLLNAPEATAAIDAPSRVRRGEMLQYQVSLTGVGRHVRLGPCPVYRQSIGGPGAYYQLNCSVGIIPSDSVTFAMRIRVPVDTKPGSIRLEWMVVMPNGEVVIADLARAGVPIEVVE